MVNVISKRLCGLAVLAAACTLAGCSEKPLSEKIDVTGSWVSTQGLISTTYQLQADGTCTRFTHIPKEMGKADKPVSGTWKLHDDLKLTLKWDNGEETRQLIVNAGMLSFYGEGQNVFYKMPASPLTPLSPTTSEDTSKTR
jgi:hypothetical protein